jgi:hypothetical protein
MQREMCAFEAGRTERRADGERGHDMVGVAHKSEVLCGLECE